MTHRIDARTAKTPSPLGVGALRLVFNAVGVILATSGVAGSASRESSDIAKSLESSPWWSEFPLPRERSEHSVIYAASRDEVVVFGGVTFDGFVNDVWAISRNGAPTWRRIVPEGTPPAPRARHTAIYDPVRDRMLVFGGDDTPPNNTTWELSLGATPTWTQLPASNPPPVRRNHAAIYDPIGDRMIVVGGHNESGYRNDVWALALSGAPVWTQLFPTGSLPPERAAHSAIYDPVRTQMVVFGGTDGSLRNDIWVLDLSGAPQWIPLVALAPVPAPRKDHVAIYNAYSDRMLVFGGAVPGAFANDVWEFTLDGEPAWSQAAPSGVAPSPRSATGAYDSASGRLVLAGGTTSTGDRIDVWDLALSPPLAWTSPLPNGQRPRPRQEHVAVYDADRDRMILFGGTGGDSWTGTWELTLDEPPVWNRLAPAGTPFAGFWNESAIVDPVRNRMVTFGGLSGGEGYDGTAALSLTDPMTWTSLTPVGPLPSARMGHSAIYDPEADRMLVFGGLTGFSLRNDSWAFPLETDSAWVSIVPSGALPPKRSNHSAIYDPLRQRMIVFGGSGVGGVMFSDVWALSTGASPEWTQLAPSGLPPAPRREHTAIYDPVGDRMVVFAGRDGAGEFNDSWALSLAGQPAWALLSPEGSPPSPRADHTAIYDPSRGRMIIFGGGAASMDFDDAWQLALGVPVGVPNDPAAGGTVRAALKCSPNPFRDETRVAFELPIRERLSLDIFDASGRHVRSLWSGSAPAGLHEALWDGRTDRRSRVASGSYFIRLRTQNESSTIRVLVTK